MQRTFALLLVLLTAISSAFGFVEKVHTGSGGDKTITRVVKLLQKLQSQSEAEGESERTLYGKFKCYCDTNDEQKTGEIAKLTEDIEIAGSEVAELKGHTGHLSQECARLKADMDANEQAREEATGIREKEAKEFADLKEDLTMSIGQLNQSIATLAEIGADQSLAKAAADHSKFMAGNKASLLKLTSQATAALKAAASLLAPSQRHTVQAFLQAPFTGSYAAQSGAVVGILKNMRDTFVANLASATEKENTAMAVYDSFIQEKEEAFETMKATYDLKQERLGANDEELATKKTQLDAMEKGKAEAEEFLSSLKDICAKRAGEYEKRVLLRTNEQAAISKAIAILNSDEAFSTFGAVAATASGGTGPAKSFLQLRSAAQKQEDLRLQAQKLLRAAASNEKGTHRLARVAGLLRAGNPFTKVLKEIEGMLELIDKESKADEKNLQWCRAERREGESVIQSKSDDIELKTAFIESGEDVEMPKMKRTIEEAEVSLDENHAAQVSQTDLRKTENMAYQKDIATMVRAESLLEKAIHVLRKYYDNLEKAAEGTGFVQQQDLPTPPKTWDTYSGQGGTDAVTMLEFILKQTKDEENQAHADENAAQHDYEDSIQELKSEASELESKLVKLRRDVAALEEDVSVAKEDLAAAVKDKEAMEAYLLSIKPGCDFIVGHIDLRRESRKAEVDALTGAVRLLKKTPAFMAAEEEAHQKSLADCQDICNSAGEDNAKCKACLVDVTVPAYCAGHKKTAGCNDAESIDDTEAERLK